MLVVRPAPGRMFDVLSVREGRDPYLVAVASTPECAERAREEMVEFYRAADARRG